jgi:serine/threonine-protein kinase
MLVGQKIGPFTIDKELGAGAMGAVYRARNIETGQRVAIKIVAPHLGTNETAMKRFKREAAILKQLDHPNIVRLVLSGKFGSTRFYAMEYIEGESLDHVMARRGRITWEEVVTLGCQLCEALKHAHEKGIIHRDLKPSNVMVLPDGTLKLTDFGIAKDMDVTALTSANCTVGTAAYMSPEQCRGERDLSSRSDLYSLGVMFYELVTGRKPFQAENPMDMFMQHVQGTFERPSRLVLDIPVWFDNLICQLLEKKPEQRPRDATTVADALERIKEKVEAQRSAGVDVVKGRASERPQLDDEDKEAARELRGKKKAKKKKQGVPFHQRIWFKAALYSALLVVIGVIFYLVFIKKPSPEVLFADAQAIMKADVLDEKVEARKEGSIARFLRYYPEHEKAGQVKAWADQIDREKVEHDVLHRLRNDINRGVDADEERAREAIKQEESGKFATARTAWEGFKKYNGSKEPEQNGYALLAAERLKLLKDVENEDARLAAHITKQGPLPAFKASSEYEEKAAGALKAELRDPADPAKGLEAWKEFQNELKRDDPTQRLWFLLAAKHIRELRSAVPPPDKESRRQGRRVRETMNQARRMGDRHS